MATAHLSDADPAIWSDAWNEEQRGAALKLQGPILVVGATGFIGSNLFFSLSRLRDDVYAVSPSAENSWRLLRSPYSNRISLDITRREDLRTTVRKYRPRTVFNLS